MNIMMLWLMSLTGCVLGLSWFVLEIHKDKFSQFTDFGNNFLETMDKLHNTINPTLGTIARRLTELEQRLEGMDKVQIKALEADISILQEKVEIIKEAVKKMS